VRPFVFYLGVCRGSVAHDVRVTSIHPVGVSIGHSPCFGPARLMP
jgi:hypothetical protein